MIPKINFLFDLPEDYESLLQALRYMTRRLKLFLSFFVYCHSFLYFRRESCLLIFYREMFRFYRRKCHGYCKDDSVLQSSEGCLSKIDIVGLSRFGRRGRMAGSSELGEISGSLILKALSFEVFQIY